MRTELAGVPRLSGVGVLGESEAAPARHSHIQPDWFLSIPFPLRLPAKIGEGYALVPP